MFTRSTEIRKLSRYCTAQIKDDALIIDQHWSYFARMPLAFLLIFAGFFAVMSYYYSSEPASTPQGTHSFFEYNKYALFLVIGIFAPAIGVFYFSKTTAVLNSKTIACKNTIIKFSYYHFKHTLNSISGFVVERTAVGTSEGPIETFLLKVLLKNSETVLIFKFDTEEEADKVREVFVSHHAQLTSD